MSNKVSVNPLEHRGTSGTRAVPSEADASAAAAVAVSGAAAVLAAVQVVTSTASSVPSETVNPVLHMMENVKTPDVAPFGAAAISSCSTASGDVHIEGQEHVQEQVGGASSSDAPVQVEGENVEVKEAEIVEDWYLASPNGDGVLGPYCRGRLAQKYELDEFDGFTPVWKQGMEAWIAIGEVAELKEALQNINRAPRAPLAEVPMQHTYTDEQGILYIYDTAVHLWTHADEYEKLLIAEGKTDGMIDDVQMVAPTPRSPASADSIRSPEPAESPKNNDQKSRKRPREDDELEELKREVGIAPETTTVGENSKPVESAAAAAKRAKRAAYRERKKLKKQAGLWMKGKSNPNVYVSGLPRDITEEELVPLFSKYGVLKTDPGTSQLKVKVYRNDDGNGKGDALITYMRPESVDLAVKYLHETQIRPNAIMCVQQAEFEEKKLDTSALTREELMNMAVANKQEREKYSQVKLEKEVNMGWDDGRAVANNPGGRKKKKPLKTMLLKGMFSEEQAKMGDADFFRKRKELVKEECEKFGEVAKVTLIERNPEGIALVRFKKQAEAEACITVMDGSKNDDRTVTARFHTGADFHKIGAMQKPNPMPKKRGGRNQRFLNMVMMVPKTAIREQDESESESAYLLPLRDPAAPRQEEPEPCPEPPLTPTSINERPNNDGNINQEEELPRIDLTGDEEWENFLNDDDSESSDDDLVINTE